MVRTLIAFGYTLDPPAGDSNHKGGLRTGRENTEKRPPGRSYRAEKNYAVSVGKWYYEFEVITPGYMKVGWALLTAPPGVEIGSDENSFAFDGSVVRGSEVAVFRSEYV